MTDVRLHALRTRLLQLNHHKSTAVINVVYCIAESRSGLHFFTSVVTHFVPDLYFDFDVLTKNVIHDRHREQLIILYRTLYMTIWSYFVRGYRKGFKT